MHNGEATSIHPVDLNLFAPQACSVLRAAWIPPCIEYSEEYLRFQTTFPSPLQPVALVALSSEPVAFVAATGRMTNAGNIYVSSFLSALPGSAACIPMLLVRQEARMIAAAKMPLLVFAEIGSIGESLLAAVDSVGLKRRSLGTHHIHAAVPRRRSSVEVRNLAPAEWAREAGRLDSDGSVLRLSFDAETLAHFAVNGRRFLAAYDDALIGTAMLGETRSIQQDGSSQSYPTLHYVRLREQSTEGLVALLSYAQAPYVLIPNTVNIGPTTARSAGLRATPSAFGAWLYNCAQFSSTEMEII